MSEGKVKTDELSDVSLRDWFAGHALAGIASAVNVHDYPDQIPRVAKTAYLLADAMLEARGE